MTIYNNTSAYHPSKKQNAPNFANLAFYDHNILTEDPDPQSLASLIMLQRSLHGKRNTHWLHKACRTHKRRFMNQQFEKGVVVCYKCKIVLVKPTPQRQTGRNVASVDHIIPIERNFAFAKDPRNYRMACQKCNCARNGK